jgi:hypothetical protein
MGAREGRATGGISADSAESPVVTASIFSRIAVPVQARRRSLAAIVVIGVVMVILLVGNWIFLGVGPGGV